MSAVPAGDYGGIEPDFAAVQAQLACTGLVTSFFEFVDDGHAARTAELFADDGSLTIFGRTFQGIESIRAAMQARQDDVERKTVHVPAQSSFRLLNPSRAEGRTYMQLYRLDLENVDGPAIRALSKLTAAFVRGADGRWRFAARELTVLAGND